MKDLTPAVPKSLSRKEPKTKSLTVFAVIALVALGLAQQPQLSPMHGSYWGIGDFIPANKGARGIGMGGCHVATAEGYQALLKNPAGVAFARENQFGIDGRVVFRGIEYENGRGLFGVEPKLWGLGAVVPMEFTHALRAGFALGWGAFYDNAFRVQTWRGDYDVERGVGGYHVLLPTASLCYDERWAAGLSLGFPVCSPYGYLWQYEQSGEDYETELTGTVKGTLVQLGALARPWPWLSLGACVTPGMELSIDEPTLESGGMHAEYEDVDIGIPSQHTLAVAFHPGSRLTLAAEYAYLPLRKIEWEECRWPGYYESWYNGIRDGAIWRIGLEYEWVVSLRVGAHWSNYWLRAEYDEPDPGQFAMVTAGFGFDAGPVRVEVGAEYGSLRPLFDWELEPGQTDYVGRVAADVVYSWTGWDALAR